MSSTDRDAELPASNLDPEAIARTTFPTSFRGYDADHVRRFLEQVADKLRDAHDREAGLIERLDAVEARLAAASRVDEDQLIAVLGEETARILTVVREAGADIKARAEDRAEQTVRDAEEQAKVVRGDADAVMARRTEEAEAEAARIRAQVDAAVQGLQAEAERALDDARTDAERIRLEAREAGGVEVEAARSRGREMVDEALVVRSRILEDLARKRKASRVQLERLQAGRERLIDSYTIVQRTLDEANEELRTSLTSAKIAADEAARRVEAEPLPSPRDLDREVEAARESPEFDEDLPQEDLVPLEPAAEFEGVRIVDDPRPNGRGETTEMIEVVEAVEVVESEEVGDEDGDTADVDVDNLFARIRASREEDVARAHDVLEAVPASDAGLAEETEETSGAEAEKAQDTELEAADDTEPEPAASDDEALLERRDAITDEVEKQAVRKRKLVLADEQNEVLDRLRRNPKSRLDDLFPAADEHRERYASVVRSSLVDVAKSGGTFYGAAPARTDVTDLANDLAEALTFPLRDRVDGSLREAAGDEEAMADGVRAVYRDWKTHRIETHTRDTVLAAFNRGLFDATKAGARQRWIVDNGGSPCPDAEDNSLAGLVVKGEPFPTGHCYPPAHPGCRCLLVAEPL